MTPEAQRALAEAAERREKEKLSGAVNQSIEHGGRQGPEPVRYGDWEKGGIASDF